jgi:hypothetical protein
MTSTIESVGILKADAKGRVRVPRERQEALLDEFEEQRVVGSEVWQTAPRLMRSGSATGSVEGVPGLLVDGHLLRCQNDTETF